MRLHIGATATAGHFTYIFPKKHRHIRALYEQEKKYQNSIIKISMQGPHGMGFNEGYKNLRQITPKKIRELQPFFFLENYPPGILKILPKYSCFDSQQNVPQSVPDEVSCNHCSPIGRCKIFRRKFPKNLGMKHLLDVALYVQLGQVRTQVILQCLTRVKVMGRPHPCSHKVNPLLLMGTGRGKKRRRAISI